MPELMTGTVTFMFTDIEGSTRLLQELGDRFPALLDEHFRLVGEVIVSHGGTVVGTEGDSFFAVFQSAQRAVAAAAEAQQKLQSKSWTAGASVKVRMGLHTGEGVLGGENYTGIDVHRAARMSAAGHGGQVLLSGTTHALVEGKLGDLSARDLGEHRLKDLEMPERIYQLVIPGLPSEFPPIRTPQSLPNNLPAQLTSFVGRGDQVAEVTSLFSKTRLLTLTGPGGTGKTRLSLAAAARLLGRFLDGVFFVELAPITDPSLILPTIAESLGLKEEGGRSAHEMLLTYLADKELVLVLDNFEQVVSGAVEVAGLLQAAPKLKILATSREPLHLAGEQEYPVPPLELPDPAHLPPPDKLSQYEAVALFIQRASAVRPGFKVTNETAPVVAEICTRLDGLPLAIELAAARIKVLSPQAILSRLENSLGLLSTPRSDLPARQRTLRNAIAWSYELLEDSEKELFRRLGIFLGGWSIEAAEAVCRSEDGEDFDMVDALGSLVDKSLVRQVDHVTVDPRFMMLETIREFALERLEDEDDIGEVRMRHARFFLKMAEEAAPHLTGDAQRADQMEAEHDNIRAVLKFALETGDAEVGLRLGAAAWRFWQLQGHFREGRKSLSDLLALPGAAEPTESRARGLGALGSIAYWQGEIETAGGCYEESLSIYRALGETDGIAEQLYNLAYVAAVLLDHSKARTLFRESAELYEKAGNSLAAAYSEYGIGMVAHLAGDPAEAKLVAEKATTVFESMDEKFGIANSISTIAEADLALGNIAKSVENTRRTLEIYRELGDLSGVAYCLEAFGHLAMKTRGDFLRAVRLAGAASSLKQKLGAEMPATLVPFPNFRAEAEKVLEPADVAAAWNEGRAMSRDEAISYALEDL